MGRTAFFSPVCVARTYVHIGPDYTWETLCVPQTFSRDNVYNR